MIPYSHDELYRVGPQRTFAGASLSEIAFPLGGIGAGTVSLGGRGNLRDWEIRNIPNKNSEMYFTLFALWAKTEGAEPVARVLEGQVPPPYRRGYGESQPQWQGVGRFRDASFRGEYPVATVELSDPAVPVTASLRAWNPFIPLNVKDSALPCAIFEWTFTNPSDVPVEISLAATLHNSLTAKDAEGKDVRTGGQTAYQAMHGLRGLFMSHPDADPNAPATGTLALTTTWDAVDAQTRWYHGGWWDPYHIFWDDFATDGRLTPLVETSVAPVQGDTGALALRATVPAHGSVTLPVVLSWHFPKMLNPWEKSPWGGNPMTDVLDTYVSNFFRDAWAVADYVTTDLPRLRADTDGWRETIFGSTLPDHVLEAATSQASILRSVTCFLTADGKLYGWEGVGDQNGCCYGNCTHVWNYEQAVAFLFPQLERTMRDTEFLHNTRETGNMAFRTHIPPGKMLSDFKPCVDGQMGTIIQVYRDWQLCGDDDFLRAVWPNVKRALEYAWTMTPEKMDQAAGQAAINAPGAERRSIDSLWDLDKDGVIEGEQHNTYDIEFFGPNTMLTGMYLGALQACARMADYLGEPEKAAEYRAIADSGRARVDAELWNGEYYIQQVKVIPEVTVPEVLRSPVQPTCACRQSPGGKAAALNEGEVMPKYQYGDGCLSDQLLGQLSAHVADLGYVLDPAHVRAAVKSIFDYNFRARIGDFNNVQRVYALGDEAGLLLCSWPHGNRPALPFVYSDEVWTGIEFQVAAHCVFEGWIDEGLAIVKGVTERYAGFNRNPWNHVECGHHYARAMAAWGVKVALDGFRYSLPHGLLGFAPKLPGAARTFWSTGTAWGQYAQEGNTARLAVRYGTQTLRQLDLDTLPDGPVTITGPTGPLRVARELKHIVFDTPLTLQAGEAIELVVG
jgi:uncharacterized protein (DUF608 family)